MDDDSRSATNQFSGNVNGPAVQAGLIEGGVHIHMASRCEHGTVPVLPSEGSTCLPSIWVEILSLLRAQVLTMRMLELVERPADPT